MTPQQLQQLRERLPVFAEDAPPSLDLQEFCRFYGLDFTAEIPELNYRAGLVPSGEFQLMTHFWQQPGATHNLLLVHGYFDHSGIYDKLVYWGLAQHCNVLIFDLPGHGLSSGERAVIDDFADYGAAVADVLAGVELPGLPLCAVGQSTGCAALVEFARHHPWPFARTALLAPLVHPAGWFGVRIAHALLHRFTESAARKFNRNSSDLQFLDFIRRDPLQCHRVSLRWIGALKQWLAGLEIRDLGVGPVLVIQGEKDTTVEWRYNMKAIAQLFPGSEFIYLPQAGHQLANEAATIREHYSRELESFLLN